MATIDVKDADSDTVAVELPLPPGTAAAASSKPVTLSNEDKALLGSLTETAPATDTASSGGSGRLQRIAQRLTSLIALFPSSLGIKTAAGSLSVAPASDATFAFTPATPATGTASSVNSGTSDVTVLASNASRKGASISNDDANALYVLLSNATSSSTNYSVILRQNDYFEVPFGYTGVIKGIWASDGSGAARVTEFT